MAAVSLSAPVRSGVLAERRAGRVGLVHSWELVTAVDGPGTRLTLFLNGCPLRCRYCHNPDTWALRDGTPTTVGEVVARIARYRRIFAATGGGLTISGGEPLLQSAFVANVFRECHDLGIRTALDTSGYLGSRAGDDLLDATDLVLLDVKSGLPSVYREVTTRDLAPTVAFGDRLSARGIPMWVRFVLVPGLTDAAENVAAVADIVTGWPSVERVEVLPFHQLGRSKWKERGLSYTLEDVEPPSPAAVEVAREQFRRRGLAVY
jgi:pyruvate formate lyase activating enzyme